MYVLEYWQRREGVRSEWSHGLPTLNRAAKVRQKHPPFLFSHDFVCFEVHS